MSRISAVVVFAIIANETTATLLGVFALISALGGAAQALGAAMVAKPLAATADPAERTEVAGVAVAAAALTAVALSAALAAGAVLTDSLLELTLAGAALAGGAFLALEAAYWALVFTRGPRLAGLSLGTVYAIQIGVTAVAASVAEGPGLVLVPAGALAVAALILTVRLAPPWRSAARWYTDHRGRWLPYVGGSAASIALVQAIPLTLTATVGLAAVSLYRAVELAFGPTNLAMGFTTNALLGRERPGRLGEVYRKGAIALASVALVNGAALAVAPTDVLGLLVGGGAGALQELVAVGTLHRTAFAISSVGAILIISAISARAVGAMNVVTAVGTLALLTAGVLIGELAGAFAGLAVAEVLHAALNAAMLRRRPRSGRATVSRPA
jgi:hypothetical protein